MVFLRPWKDEFFKTKIQVSEKTNDLPFRRIDFTPLNALNQIKLTCTEDVKSFFETAELLCLDHTCIFCFTKLTVVFRPKTSAQRMLVEANFKVSTGSSLLL